MNLILFISKISEIRRQSSGISPFFMRKISYLNGGKVDKILPTVHVLEDPTISLSAIIIQFRRYFSKISI